jgi:hypothetical protein
MNMNNVYIERLLKNQYNFQGVFSSDTLPTTPRLLVCNTDPAHKPGEHWIAIYVDKNGFGEYFDSFGRPPSKHFEHYMNYNCSRWIFNKKQLQSIISAFCGYYCCMYVILRSRGNDMTQIVGMLTNDTGYNDWLVHRFLCNKR